MSTCKERIENKLYELGTRFSATGTTIERMLMPLFMQMRAKAALGEFEYTLQYEEWLHLQSPSTIRDFLDGQNFTIRDNNNQSVVSWSFADTYSYDTKLWADALYVQALAVENKITDTEIVTAIGSYCEQVLVDYQTRHVTVSDEKVKELVGCRIDRLIDHGLYNAHFLDDDYDEYCKVRWQLLQTFHKQGLDIRRKSKTWIITWPAAPLRMPDDDEEFEDDDSEGEDMDEETKRYNIRIGKHLSQGIIFVI